MFPRKFLGLLVLGGSASGQCFNLDFGDAFGTPSSAYEAAAGQPGTWQTILPVNGATVPLTDVSGTPTGATAHFKWGPLGTSGVGGADLDPTGDDERLVDDWWWHNSQDYSTLFQVRFKGLDPGLYRIYSYAWWGDTPQTYGRKTLVVVPRGGRVQALSGEGPWPGHHVLAYLRDGTYVTEAVPSADGRLRIDYHSVAFPSAVNGLQLVQIGACTNTLFEPYCDQGPIGACDPVILAGGRPSVSGAAECQLQVVGAN